MDTWLHYLKIVRYMYRLEEPDLLYVVDSATSLLNWAIPAVVGGWLVKRLYLLERKPVRLRVRLGLSLCPLLFPVLSVSFLYFLYFQNDPRLPGLIQKYPIGFDFLSRPKISPMRKKTQVKAAPKGDI